MMRWKNLFITPEDNRGITSFIGFMSGIFTTALSIAFLWHLSCIWIYKRFEIIEPSIAILLIETIVIVFIALFGIASAFLLVRRRK